MGKIRFMLLALLLLAVPLFQMTGCLGKGGTEVGNGESQSPVPDPDSSGEGIPTVEGPKTNTGRDTDESNPNDTTTNPEDDVGGSM